MGFGRTRPALTRRARQRRARWQFAIVFVLACVAHVHVAGTLLVCHTGCPYSTVQSAVTAAVPGDTIKLRKNETFTEQIVLPNKGVTSSFITITTDAALTELPDPGVRLDVQAVPSYIANLPKIQSPGGGAIPVTTDAAANHYKFQFVEFLPVPHGFNSLIDIGAADSTQQFETQEPTDFVVDQCYLHGDPVAGQKRGIEPNGKRITITNNYFAQFTATFQDSQCIAGWNGHGPVTIENNYLECGTENVMFGGSDPSERTLLTATGSPTTTSIPVATSEAGHTLAELRIGQTIIVQTAGATKYEKTIVRSISSSTSTGTLGVDALSTVPDVPGHLWAGVLMDGVTIRRNHITKKASWMTDAILATPTALTPTPSTASGTLPAGQKCYRVQAAAVSYAFDAITGEASTEVCATLGATGQISVPFTTVTGAASYHVFRGTTPSGEDRYATVTSSPFVDDGTAGYTFSAIPAGNHWKMKNLFEFKAVTHLQMDSNVLENDPHGIDAGFGMWFKASNQNDGGNGGCLWCESGWITFELNILRHTYGMVEINAREAGPIQSYCTVCIRIPPPPLHDVTIQNNLIYDSNGTWGQGSIGYAITLQGGGVNIKFLHNTMVHLGLGLISTDSSSGLPFIGLVINDNLMRAEIFGIHDPTANNAAALAAAAPGYVFQGNAVADGNGTWPQGNGNAYESAALWEGEFVAYSADGFGADYHLKPTSAYKHAGTDGKDIGCDVDAVLAATAGVVTGTSVAGLPFPWQTTDIGTVGLAGKVTYSGGIFTVQGAGSDIFGTVDSFRFLYQTIATSQNLVMTARLLSETNTSSFAKGGLMIRSGLSANSAHVVIDLKPDNTLEFMWRATSGATTTFVGTETQSPPTWLRLLRVGNDVTGQVSSDGVSWRTLGTVTTTLPVPLSVGVVVSSHDPATLMTAIVDNISGIPIPKQPFRVFRR